MRGHILSYGRYGEYGPGGGCGMPSEGGGRVADCGRQCCADSHQRALHGRGVRARGADGRDYCWEEDLSLGRNKLVTFMRYQSLCITGKDITNEEMHECFDSFPDRLCNSVHFSFKRFFWAPSPARIPDMLTFPFDTCLSSHFLASPITLTQTPLLSFAGFDTN